MSPAPKVLQNIFKSHSLIWRVMTVGETHPPEKSPGVMFGVLAASVSV